MGEGGSRTNIRTTGKDRNKSKSKSNHKRLKFSSKKNKDYQSEQKHKSTIPYLQNTNQNTEPMKN